jgi:hypothetical protein
VSKEPARAVRFPTSGATTSGATTSGATTSGRGSGLSQEQEQEQEQKHGHGHGHEHRYGPVDRLRCIASHIAACKYGVLVLWGRGYSTNLVHTK